MAPPEHLVLRNLSATSITIVRIANFPIAKPPGPVPVTLKNLHNIGNLTHHLTRALRTSGVAPAPQPTNITIAENAKAFTEHDVKYIIPPFCTIQTAIKLTDGAVLRLVFEDEQAGRFRIDLGGSEKPTVVCLTPTAPTRFNGVFHKSHSHLALFSTAALQKWQERLKDEVPLSSISIPGTHNSPTCFRALPSVRCQAVSIRTQLENGIRFFDIRCQVENNGELTLVHAAFPIVLSLAAKKLQELLDETYKFLDTHPHETIIMSLKREGWGKATDEVFAKHLKEHYIDPQSHRWWLDHTRVPKLGEVRGKCVLFRRFLSATWKVGINAEDWRYNSHDTSTPDGMCRVQDFCEVLEAPSIDKKITYIKDHLERAAVPVDGKPLFVNFLSGCNFWKVGCWPENVAEKVNVEVKRHLAVDHLAGKHGGDGACGVVVCDFVGDRGEWDLVRLIVAMNAWIEKSSEMSSEMSNGDGINHENGEINADGTDSVNKAASS